MAYRDWLCAAPARGVAGRVGGISLVAFALATLAPGDPAFTLLEMQSGGVAPTATAVAAYREQLGLNTPAPVRYWRWLADAVQGNLGVSYRTGQPVAAELAVRLPATLTLAGASLIGKSSKLRTIVFNLLALQRHRIVRL